MLARMVRYGSTIRLLNLGIALRFCPATTRGWLWRALFRKVPGNFVGPRGRGRKILGAGASPPVWWRGIVPWRPWEHRHPSWWGSKPRLSGPVPVESESRPWWYARYLRVVGSFFYPEKTLGSPTLGAKIVTGPAFREFSNEEMKVLFNSINKNKNIQKLEKVKSTWQRPRATWSVPSVSLTGNKTVRIWDTRIKTWKETIGKETKSFYFVNATKTVETTNGKILFPTTTMKSA
jgi:hypothetical protein